MSERRLTMHNGRTHKGGKVFSSKHNDHSEENGKWDKTKAGENWLWQSKNAPGETFDEGEKVFYEKFFRKSLDKQNQRHKESRHLNRIKTMDEFRKTRNYCPEETLIYLGDKDNQVTKDQLKEVVQDFIDWHKKEYKQCVTLNLALHGDEEGAIHFHQRKVWMAKDENGDWIVSQNKSLEQMGIQRPNLEEPVSSKNNAKMTYTKACRDKLFEIAKSKGIDLVEEPREKGKSGKSRSEFIEEQVAKKVEICDLREEKLNSRENILNEKEKVVEGQIQALKALNEEDKQEFEEQKETYVTIERNITRKVTKELNDDFEKRLSIVAIIKEGFNELRKKLGLIKERVDKRTKLIQEHEPEYKMELEMPEENNDYER